ncbi:MAG: hypothetical protein GQF41_4286 [Candidatus Rifleibacterium amylolyticum]|nr:MAG: hypothetical protein GQF41_4286 [Candidatus Rifleibacterium amylolyticum]
MSEQRTKIIIETDAGRSEQVLRSVQKGLQDVGSEANKAGQNVKTGAGIMDSSFVKTALSAAALGTAVKGAFSMAKEASQLSEARLYLQTLTSTMGISFDQLQQATKKASNGLVDNLTLIRMNHKALKLGVSTDVGEIARLWQISDAVGDEFGQSIEQTFDRLVKAISKGSKEELIQLGLLPPAFKQASDATELLNNRSLLLKSVLEQAGASADVLAKHGTTVNDKFTQLDTSVTDLKHSLGEGLIPVMIPTVEWLTQIATQIDEIVNASNRLNGITANQGEAGQLAKIRERKFELAQQQTAINKAKKAESYSSAAGILESAGINVGWLDEIDKVIEKEENRITLELKSLETQRERIKLAGKLSAQKDREAEATKKEADEAARKKEIEEERRKAEEEARRKRKQAQDELNKQLAVGKILIQEFQETFADSFGFSLKTTKSLKDAQNVLTAMAAAAGGFAVGLKDGDTEAGKLEKKFRDLNDDVLATLAGAGKNWGNELKNMTLATANTKMMDFMSGGLFTAAGGSIPDTLNDIKEPLSKTIAEAVQAGFANADFSNLSMTLGNILNTVISKSVAQSNPVMNAAGGINFGNLGINLATNFVLGRLTGSGGIFGGRQEKFKAETLQAASDLRSQMSAAWVKSHEVSMLPYLSWQDKNQLAAGRFGYHGTQTGYSWSDSGDGFFSKKTRTYNLIDQGASAALATLNEAIERAEKNNRSVEMGYELQSAKGFDYQALVGQEAAYRKAANLAYGGSYSLNWTDGGKDTADLAEAAHEIKMAAAEMARSLGAATGERNTQVAQGFAQYAPWLDTMYMSGGLPSNLRANILSQITGMIDMDKLSSSQQYDAFAQLQTGYMDRNISPYLLDMVKQAGASKYDLESLRLTDAGAYAEKYLEYLEKQMTAYEEVKRRQEEIFNNAAKSYEERSAALSAFERNQEAYYQTKLEALAAEQAAEEAIKAKQQEKDARSIERLGAALSLFGEVSQRGDRIVIIQGGDTTKALQELRDRFSDDPEMVATLQTLIRASDKKAMWG